MPRLRHTLARECRPRGYAAHYISAPSRDSRSKAIRIHLHGGPEVLVWKEVSSSSAGPSEAIVRHKAVGLNCMDVYFRTGRYKLTSLPAVIGMKGTGIVGSVGADVTAGMPGDRVAYPAIGASAHVRTIPAEKRVKLPVSISADTAAAIMLQGMTAQYLPKRTYRLAAGDTILVHAAADGVFLCANGRSTWAPPSSASSRRKKRQKSPGRMRQIMSQSVPRTSRAR